MVERKSRIAFRERAKRAMLANGYVVIVEDGWVVKKYSDGRIEQIKELDTDSQDMDLILD